MNDIDLDLLAALTGRDRDDVTPDLMERDSELRARYEGALALREALEEEGAQRRAFVDEALARPAPGEDRIRELVLAEVRGQAAPRRGIPGWTMLLAAAAIALLWLRPWADSAIEPAPIDEGPVQVLGGPEDGLRLLDAQDSDGGFGELRWTEVAGGDVTYDVLIWGADLAGAPLDPAAPLRRERHLTETTWAITDEADLPDSILIEVRALDGGALLESTPRVWRQRSSD